MGEHLGEVAELEPRHLGRWYDRLWDGDKMEKRRKSCLHQSLIAMQAVLFLFFMLGGCTSIQERPDRHEDYEKIPFSEILRSPEEHRGKVIRLGGVILNVANEERGTVLEILEKPLSWRGRPKPGDASGGRFMAVFVTFLDKAIFRPHRAVTIIGEVIGVEKASIGEMAYDYPLLSGREIRLWQARGYFDRFCVRIGIIGSGSNVAVSVGTSF